MRLLITERDPLVRHYLGCRAEELGVQMAFARDARELMAAIDDCPPDCVVLDASSSTMDEDPLWQQLRERPDSQHIPILLYSSSNRWQIVAQLAGDRLDGYLPRPFDTDAIISAVKQATARQRTVAPACA